MRETNITEKIQVKPRRNSLNASYVSVPGGIKLAVAPVSQSLARLVVNN